MSLRTTAILTILLTTFAAAPTSAAETNTNTHLKISRPGDTELSCGALSREATTMRDIINTTQTMQDISKRKSRATAVAGTAASLLIGTVTGGAGLAAAGFFIDNNLSGDANQANTTQQTAQQRRSFVMGIHNAKNCYGPLDHALQTSTKTEKIATAKAEPTASPPSQYNQ